MNSPDGTLDAAFFEEMVETVGVGVAIYGSDGVYRYVNQAYAEMLGTDRDALVGTPLWEVVAAFDGDRFDEYWASFDTGETRTARAEHRFGDRTVPVSTVTTRRRIDGTDYNFGAIQDISELVAREAELEEKTSV